MTATENVHDDGQRLHEIHDKAVRGIPEDLSFDLVAFDHGRSFSKAAFGASPRGWTP